MTSPQARAKRAGAKFELDLLAWFRNQNLPSERLRLSGRLDEGDIAVTDTGLTYLVEAKNVKTINLTDFVRQAEAEARNYANARGLDPATVMPVVAIKKRNAPIEESFIVTSARHFFTL